MNKTDYKFPSINLLSSESLNLEGCVRIRDAFESPEWKNSNAKIPIVMGKADSGEFIVHDLEAVAPVFIAGALGYGNDSFINSIVSSILYKFTPDEFRFVFLDLQMTDFTWFNELPHAILPVAESPEDAQNALSWVIKEFYRRASLINQMGIKNIDVFNEILDAGELDQYFLDEIPTKKIPYLMYIINEFSRLPEIARNDLTRRIYKMNIYARHVGIFLVITTHHPSEITIPYGLNEELNMRVKFKHAPYMDERFALAKGNLENPSKPGEMILTFRHLEDSIRAKSLFIADDEMEALIEAVKENGKIEYSGEAQEYMQMLKEKRECEDALTPKALEIIRDSKRASISYLQRKLCIGYNRASAIMDELEEKGVVGPNEGPSNPRKIFL